MDLRLWLWMIVSFILLPLTVTRRPKNHNSRRGLLAEVQSEMVPYTDNRAILKCITSPMASIEWLFDGDLIDDTDQRFTREKDKLFVHFNRIATTKWSENPFKSRMFQCKATLNTETVISEPAKLIITFLDDFASQNDSIINTIQGNTAVISCKPPNSMPIAIIEYYFNQTLISKSNDHYLLSNSGNLQILNPSVSDSGIYRCVAFNAFLRERKNASWTIELNVKPSHRSKVDAHQIYSSINDNSAKNFVYFVIKPSIETKAVMGSNITLECVAGGIKPPKITWFKKRNNELESLNMKNSRQVAGNLILMTVDEKDSGTYVCRATVDDSTIEASTFVDVQMTPRFVKSLKDLSVVEGNDFTLECQAKGNPKPRINWFFNGKSLNSFKDKPPSFNFDSIAVEQNTVSFSEDFSKLNIKAAQSSIHAGIYQCFVSNELLNSDFKSTYSLARVVILRPGEIGPSKPSHHGNSGKSTDLSNLNTNNEDNFQGITVRPYESSRKRPSEIMIPPSKPKIVRLSDDSVMVHWEISNKPSLEISFFKVQYKEMAKKSRWNTWAEDTPPFITSQKITGLVPDAKYRFRVTAVYVNDDNRESPASDKFHLIRTSMLKKPNEPPTIKAVTPRSPTSIEIFWENHREIATSIEGFFIHYRATSSAGEYFQITVLGSNKLSHVIHNLSPATSYEFKIQCFNSAGVSDFSQILTAATLEDPISTTTEMTNVIKGLDKVLDSRIDNNTDIFFIIVGSVGGFALIVFIVCCIIQCSNRFKQTPQRKKDGQIIQRVNGEINNGSLLHRTIPSLDDYKNESDTLSSHPDKSSINNVTASISNDHFPIYHEEVKEKKNYQTKTYMIDTYCEDSYGSRTGSWSRKSRKKCYEAEAGLKLITSASSHNSLPRKYLYENDNIPSTLERRRQAFKSEEHLKCSLNARIHSKSSSFTRLDGTLERKKRRTATPVASPQPPPIPERQINITGHRSLSSSRLNGSLEKRKKSRPDYGNTNTNKNGTKSTESKMNSYNGAISHLNTKPPLLIMQSTC
ncbi:interference hedgehog-like [Tetranychus urticae]|uniref:Uncharacterized protein n=1 Tax=Tetranychus urticae TaxID=32264 RepID=T1KXS1_TETUR|nr:interference hedgehog-like [Tetranychus urticae]XP_015791495.1 interference hedgehog-like [Tetranychus urticae]XP_015791496.1 interference hedgehog-like [Tetranychus urticae]XP_015791498.1 interference hedgehog-like [Tetranychus urticae]XP_015791499.1 interference hedgehog-like [Tetranychus urticae]